MHRSFTTATLAAVTLGSPAHADFITPSTASEGWDRGTTTGSLYAEWDIFSSPFGPNSPDVAQHVGGDLPDGSLPFDVFDANEASGSFIVSSGNIYSFSGIVSPQIEIPGFGLGSGFTTTILVQIRTLGSELDAASVLLDNSIRPDEVTELDRVDVGGGFGGYQVDTLIRFDVPGNDAGHTVNFIAEATSMSLDRVAVDTFVFQAGCNEADIAAPSGTLDLADINAFVTAFVVRDPAADLDSNDILDLSDIDAFVGAFSGGCP